MTLADGPQGIRFPLDMKSPRFSPRMPGMARLVLLLAALAFLAAPARSQNIYQVWWSPLLDLPALSGVDTQLRAPFDPDDRIELRKGDIAVVENCLALTRRVDSGYRPATARDSTPFGVLTGHCYTLAALKQAKAATESYVRDFTMTSGALDDLPAMVGAEWCEAQLDTLLAANRAGVSWSEFTQGGRAFGEPSGYRVTVSSRDQIVVERRVGATGVVHDRRVSIMGRGDFSGDGIDDLLVQTTWRNGAEVGSTLFVVSRVAQGDPLRVVATRGPLPDSRSACGPAQPEEPEQPQS